MSSPTATLLSGDFQRAPYCTTLSPHTPSQCHIAVLPDEILLEIFSYIPLKAHWEVRKGESQAPLVFVCQKWHRVYEPILFRRIPLAIGVSGHFPEKTIPGARQLLAMIKAHPQIRNYPRALHLELNYPASLTFPDLLCLIELCKELRTIILHSDILRPSLPFFQTLISHPLLEDLTLGGYFELGPTLELIFQTFSLPKLKRLRLESYQLRGDYFDPILPFRNAHTGKAITGKTLEDLQAPYRHHRSSVEILELLDPRCQPLVTEYILRGYSCLVDLALTCFSKRAMDFYSTDEIQKLLDMHSKSLKRIKLGFYANGGAAMPNFTEFPCLEEVHLSAYNVVKTAKQDALEKLSAPKLQLLTLAFNTEDEYIGIHQGLKVGQNDCRPRRIECGVALWIEYFALLKKSHSHEVKLDKVNVEFRSSDNPHRYRFRTPGANDSDTSLIWSDHGVEWPWEQLEVAREKAAVYGLKMEYSKPTWTREEWDRIIRYGDVQEAGKDLNDDDDHQRASICTKNR